MGKLFKYNERRHGEKMQKLKKVVALVLTVAMLMTTMIMPVYAASADFADTQDHWAKEAVNRWATSQVLKGDYGTNNFRPDDNMTRAEMAVVASVLLGLDLEKDSYSKSFTDVANDAWYAKYVLACADNGIINGMGDGTYRPDANITREQAFTIISSAIQLKASDADLSKFADADSVSPWAVPYVQKVVGSKAIHGYAMPDGSYELRPQNPITRAEVAKILDYLITVYVAADGSVSVSGMIQAGDPDMGNQVVINQIVVNDQNDKDVKVVVEEKVENGEPVKEIQVFVGNVPKVEIVTGNTEEVPAVIVGNGNPVEIGSGDSVVIKPGEEHEGDDYGKCTHITKIYACKNCAVKSLEEEVVCSDENCTSSDLHQTYRDAHGHKMVNGVCECCGMTVAQAMKFHAWVESNDNAVDVYVSNDYAAQITVDPGKVVAKEVTIGVEMQNVGSLGVNGVKKHEQTFNTGLNGDPELKVWLKNVFEFKSGTVNANIDGKEVSYALAGSTNADGQAVITATPSKVEAARTAWGELTGHVATKEQAESDSYVKIANGSYMIVAQEKLCFEKGTDKDLVLDNFGDLDAMEAQIRSLVQLTGAQKSDYEAQFFLAAGTELAVSNSIAVLEDDCLVTVDADKLGQVEGIDTILSELRDAKSGYEMAEKVVKLVNELVGAANGSTIDVNFTFSEPVQKDTKFYFGVTANNADGNGTTTVDMEVFDDYSLEINLPMNKLSAKFVTLTAIMKNVGSLGVDGTREHSQTINTGMTATGDLAVWMKNAAKFEKATVNVTVKGTDNACTYELVSDMDADWVTITGSVDEDAARGVWHAIVNDATIKTKTQEVSDSYIKIAKGSYINTGAETLKFEEGFEGEALVLDNFSDLGALKASIKEAVCAVKNATVGEEVTLYVAAGTELAVSNSVATLKQDCKITISGIDLDDNLLSEIREASNGGNEALVKALFNILNDLVGAANNATVDVEVEFIA